MATKIVGFVGAGVLAVGSFGFWLGRATVAHAPSPPLAAIAAARPDRALPRAEPCREIDVAALKSDWRRMLREELAARQAPERELDPRGDDDGAPRPERATKTIAAPDPEAHARAERLVEDALRSRRLSQDSAFQLRVLLPRVGDEQRVALVSRLYSAINEGAVVPDAPRRSL